MARIEFELKDCDGNDVEIGDEIEVTLPEIELWQYPGDEIEYYRPRVHARAKVFCSPSKGLQIKLLEIENIFWMDDDLKEEFSINVPEVGYKAAFRRTVWKWRKLTSGCTATSLSAEPTGADNGPDNTPAGA